MFLVFVILFFLCVTAVMLILSAALLGGCTPKDPFEGCSCITRLRIIDGAKQNWALDHHKTTNDVPTWYDIRGYLSRRGEIPVCPAGGVYTLGRVGEQPKCSYP